MCGFSCSWLFPAESICVELAGLGKSSHWWPVTISNHDIPKCSSHIAHLSILHHLVHLMKMNNYDTEMNRLIHPHTKHHSSLLQLFQFRVCTPTAPNFEHVATRNVLGDILYLLKCARYWKINVNLSREAKAQSKKNPKRSEEKLQQ